MHVVSVVGEGSSSLADRLTEELADAGSVATVSTGAATDGGRTRAAGTASGGSATFVHELGDGRWRASAPERSLDEVVDDCARSADYLVVDGAGATRYPTVVVGEADVDDGVDVIARVDSPEAAELGDLIETVEATEPHETLASLVEAVKRSPRAERSGAIATFTGRVRAKDAEDDERTELLEFEKYEGVAEERMDALARELEERPGVFEVRMHHRTGVVADGEDIVFVVVLAGHRGEAFETVEDGIDRLKEEVPIFKKEVTVDGEFWVHERA
jgi:molybdopterin synthase catalytic subunit